MGLFKQTYKDWDLMIIDDCSDVPVQTNPLITKIVGRISREGHNVKIKRFDKNIGIATARACILDELKKYKYVVDLNDDHFLEPDCLERLREVISNENIGAVTPATPFFFGDDEGNDPIYFIHKKYDPNRMFNAIRVSKGENGEKRLTLSRQVDYIYDIKKPIKIEHGSQLMYKPELIDELPKHYSNLGFTEETDLSLRIAKAGKEIWFVPTAINWHLQSSQGGTRSISLEERRRKAEKDFDKFHKTWWDWLWENGYR